MLEGAARFLNVIPKPIWMVEVCVDQNQPHGVRINPDLYSVFSTFWENGYCAYTADRNLRLVTKIEIQKIIETEVDTLGLHNFLFVDQLTASKILRSLQNVSPMASGILGGAV